MIQKKAGQPSPASHELRANVVDIRRFSTHDGDGIRTTVFLKGCPLACVWCQNPETINARRGPVFFASKCIDCNLCVVASQHGEVTREHGVITPHLKRSGDWEAVVDSCPTGALAFNATSYTVAELVHQVMADRAFFGHGGGVTLSGGEPLFMPHFASRVLQCLQEQGVHTAIETALNVRTEFVLESLAHVDQFFADFKIFDNAEHQRWIGQPNDLIKTNIAALLTSERAGDVIVRTPLIPGVTATEENIGAIVGFICGLYPEVRYELLNYNPLAIAKYELLPNREFLFSREQNPRRYTSAEMAAFRDIARDAGVRNLVVD